MSSRHFFFELVSRGLLLSLFLFSITTYILYSNLGVGQNFNGLFIMYSEWTVMESVLTTSVRILNSLVYRDLEYMR